jgi:nucleotide-binding universal stress UspA family protein
MYQKVLVPLDGSELAECSLPHVINLAKAGSVGEVILLNVALLYVPIAEGAMSLYRGLAEIRERAADHSNKYLAGVASRLGSEGIKVKTESREGELPAEIISDYARKNGIDLIVIATHGYTGLKKMMLGSVALELIHDAHMPVLLIRPESCRV